MTRTGPRTEPCGILQVRVNEEEMCGEMAMADVREQRYEMNHCSEREDLPNQVERRWSRMEWSRVSKAADRSRRQRQKTCCMEIDGHVGKVV